MRTAARDRIALDMLVAANAVSLTGNVLAAVAVPWFVLETTGSAAKTGIAAFFTTLPLALGANRAARRRLVPAATRGVDAPIGR